MRQPREKTQVCRLGQYKDLHTRIAAHHAFLISKSEKSHAIGEKQVLDTKCWSWQTQNIFHAWQCHPSQRLMQYYYSSWEKARLGRQKDYLQKPGRVLRHEKWERINRTNEILLQERVNPLNVRFILPLHLPRAGEPYLDPSACHVAQPRHLHGTRLRASPWYLV